MSEHRYDPDGLRVWKRADGKTTHYIFEGTEPIYEKRVTEGISRSYVYALGKYLARVEGAIGSNVSVFYYHTDHLGSIRAVTNSVGDPVWKSDYKAFGEDLKRPEGFDEWHGFTGKEYDPDAELYYFNARWYDPELGRFVSEDPVGDPNSPNLYVYCGNNPLNRTDPTGLYCPELEAIIPYGAGYADEPSTSGNPGPSPAAGLTTPENKEYKQKLLGEVPYQEKTNKFGEVIDDVDIDDQWEEENMMDLPVPEPLQRIFGKTIHVAKLAENNWRRVFELLQTEYKHHLTYASLIKTCEGVFNARYQRNSRTALSNHSFGLAVDVNASLEETVYYEGKDGEIIGKEIQPYIDIKPKKGDYNIDLSINISLVNNILYENVFKPAGFGWGMNYQFKSDGMHFEVERFL